ncbi:MAG: cell division ATP-binding protein FtsE [Saccharofermentans sp.]|nr:cell division ATP-binding protein FtsE [Saccharofermentans sp.]
MIVFENVHKTYKSGVDALRGIDFEIKDGEFVFIIGKSGSGKSTLMKCITCEEVPTEGNVYIDGFNISSMSRALVPVLRRQIGMIYQDFRLIETKTVFENIAFAGEIIGIPKRSLAQTVQLVLNIVGLKDKADAYPQELSGGEQQRVAIARAMVNNPKLIVADEPTGNLDPETSENIMAILQEINRSGSTVVVCTHDSNLVDRMKKRVIEIDSGLIARDEEDSKYEHVQKPVEKDFEGYGIENPGFAFGDDPNFEEDGEYSDNYDDDNYEAPKSEFFFGETPPEVVAKEKAEAEAAAAAAIAAEKAAKEEAEALDAAKDAVEETVEEVAAAEEETTEEIFEASEAEEDETYENYSALIEEDDGESDVIPEDEPEEAASEEKTSKEEEKKDPSDFVFNDDEKKVEETKEEKKEDAKEEAEEDKNDDWIEEVSLNDIDLDIQEDDD